MPSNSGYRAGQCDRRPWGRWSVLAVDSGYAVKRIEVEPGQILSLQTHRHRAEHWVIIDGEAAVTIGDTTTRQCAGSAAFIAAGAAHRIANVGARPLVFIEVQVGDRLEESDIVRLEDTYGRKTPAPDA